MSTRNILASPSTLGFDGFSILWILCFHSFLLLFGLDQPVMMLILFGLPIFVFIGWSYSRFLAGQKKIERLILMGLTFNLLVGAIFSLWQFLFLAFNLPFPVELWFGHFRFANMDAILILGLIEALMLGGWFLCKKDFLLYSLGKSVAQNLGLNHKRLFFFLFVSISLGTFAVIGLFGAFSFLGLIFPIVARKLWFKKYDLKGEFLIGALINGLSLMAIDAICYFFPIYGAEIPVGLIATAVGAVSLILLLWQSDGHLEILAKSQK
jgi:ABC-type Fe3+-siderophore transport system permease subunit